ncbi:MAG TPA: hypothetical protein VGQ57_08600, partial [Polyangiaceae bacterium]|nr:hypothetical protein [Polyangiaceae bacterium]
MSGLGFATTFCLIFGGFACGPSAARAAGNERPTVTPPAPAVYSFATAGDARSDGERLAARWAPVFAQEVSAEHPERDRPLRVDFDDDWVTTNDWMNLAGNVRHREAVAYVSSILTTTHAFLTYTLFYPRDWQEIVCVPYACHDNDLEVVELVVARAARTGEGDALVFVETKTHRDYLAVRGAEVARAA